MNQQYKLARVALAILGLASSSAAMAQLGPFYIGASQTFTHDSNLYRQPTGEVSDNISTTALLAGFSLPVSRQRFFGNAAVRYNRYSSNDQLNNTGYGLDAGWDWETINNLSGTIRLQSNQSLVNFSEFSPLAGGGGVLTTGATRERSDQFLARGQLGGPGRFALEATYIHRDRNYSAAALATSEFKQDTIGVGLLYKPSGLLTLGTALRHTQGRLPALNDDYDRNDLDLTAVWEPTGLSKLAARLSYSKEEHDPSQSVRDFSGVTGALTWDYRPTAKLRFVTDLIRDTGNEASFNGYQFVGGQAGGNTSYLTNAAQVRADFAATAKISVYANARYAERKLSSAADDRTGSVGLGANWQPTRSVTLGCGVQHEKRGAGGTGAYTLNVASCLAQLKLER